MSMSTTPTTDREVERTYLVALTPLDGPDDSASVLPDGTIEVTDGRSPYDAVQVRLRYTLDEAGSLDGRSERALTEAIRRAERLERKHHITADDTLFAGTAELVRERIVDYLPRTKPQQRRAR